MRKIDGYVCVTQSRREANLNLIFGINTGGGTASYQNIETNDFRPFNTEDDANKGKRDLERIMKFDVRIAKLEMAIAETEEEIEQLENDNFVVIMRIEMNWQPILGPYVEGRPFMYPLPGAYLTANGFTTYNSLERAMHQAREVNRQGGCGARIANLRLNYLNSG